MADKWNINDNLRRSRLHKPRSLDVERARPAPALRRNLPPAPSTPAPSAPAPSAPATAPPDAVSDEAHLKGMRWLYDNDADYQKAQKKIAAEIAREKLKKELAKKARLDKVGKLKSILFHQLKVLPVWLYKLIRRLFTRLIRKENRKKSIIGAAALTMCVVLLVVVLPRTNGAKLSPTVSTDSQQAPSFKTVTPGGDITATHSGKIAFDPAKNVASYTDMIAETGVTVSQQPLPEAFLKDPDDELKKFAQGINATEKLEVENGTAYLGTSAKGPQTIVIIKNQNLIFITADKKLPYPELHDYINSLR